MHLGNEGQANLRSRIDVDIPLAQAARARSARMPDPDRLRTFWLSTLICGANERVNYMAPTERQHDLANADDVSAMSLMVGASTYGVSMPILTNGLVREVSVEWRSVGDDGHVGVWTSVPMTDRNSLRHSNIPKTFLEV